MTTHPDIIIPTPPPTHHMNTTAEIPTMSDLTRTIPILRHFINPAQLSTMGDACRSEERDWFKLKFVELAAQISAMPETYAQADAGDAALAHLHYFTGSADFYITEKDAGSPTDSPEDYQSQAFGLAKFAGGEAELGYISLPEILACGAELDLHWTPQPISTLR